MDVQAFRGLIGHRRFDAAIKRYRRKKRAEWWAQRRERWRLWWLFIGRPWIYCVLGF